MTRVVDHCHRDFLWRAALPAAGESLRVADGDVRGDVVNAIDQLRRNVVLTRCFV